MCALCLALLLFAPEEPAFTVAGRVLRPDGKPAEAAVYLWDALAGDRPLAQGRTDADGRFYLRVSRSAAARREHPFGPVRVAVHEPGLARAERRAVPGDAALSFRLARPAKWEGTVKSRAGDPLPGAPVVARQGSIELATTTGEDGRFSFRDLGPGKTSVTADATGFRAATIGEGALAFVLDPLPVVEGQLVDADSLEPLAGAVLVALEGNVVAESGADGRFSMEMEGGRGAVAAYLEDYALTRFDFKGGAIPLERAPRVAGTVAGKDGKPVPHATVRLDPGFGPPRTERADAAGSFTFPFGLTRYAFVEADAPGYLPARATVDPGWRTDRVRIVLQKGRAVEGSVLMDGEPVLGAEVVFLRGKPPFGREEVARAYTNAAGKFRVAALPESAAFARARAGARASPEVPVEGRMWLRLEDDPPVTGVVRDGAGNPAAGVAVETGGGRAATDEGGGFSVPAGDGELRIVESEAWLGLRRAVEPGQRLELTIARKRGPHALVLAVEGERGGPAAVTLRGDGRERVRWLLPSEDEVRFEALSAGTYRLKIDAPGYQDAEREVAVAAGEAETRFVVDLPRAGTLRLRANAGASVVIVTLQGEPAPVQSLKLADGTEEVAGFGPGRYRFLARAQGEAIVVREVAVGAKDPPADVDLAGGPASTLRVVVKDAAGEPVRGASIDLVTPGGFVFRTGVKTDGNGAATLPRLILGRLQLTARKGEKSAQKPIEVEPGRTYEHTLAME